MDVNALKYAKTHEWVALEGDIATIGITDFAVQALTDLVYIDLPAVGKTIAAGQRFGEVESVKAVSDLYAPVSGEVTAVNPKVVNDLGLLSEKPFDAGWLLKVKVAGSLPATLFDRGAYVAHCESEKH